MPQLLRELYPDAREVFLVRDFRDMLCSIRAFNEKRGTSAFGLEGEGAEVGYVQDMLGPSVDNLLHEWRSRADRAHLVRYEDLITDERGTLERVLDYLGVDSDEATVQGMLQTASEDRLNGQEAHRTSATAAESIGRWARDLDSSFQAACDSAFEEVHSVFGY